MIIHSTDKGRVIKEPDTAHQKIPPTQKILLLVLIRMDTTREDAGLS